VSETEVEASRSGFVDASVQDMVSVPPDVVPVLEQVEDVVDAVDVVDVVDVVSFLQPGIRNNGRDKTRIILNDFNFSSSGNNPNVN